MKNKKNNTRIDHLVSLRDRLKDPGKLGFLLIKQFSEIIKGLKLPIGSTALSVSTGDGLWDYLTFINNQNIKNITATDIVNCPVKKSDIFFLTSFGKWEFVKVRPEENLPSEDKTFDLVFHQEVLEHVARPFKFLSEQFRVLKKNGVLVFGTPNLFRPVNIVKIASGKLNFPTTLNYNEEIGDYIHIQEYNERQVVVLLEEIGFKNVFVFHSYFGIIPLDLILINYPKGKIGKLMCQYLTFLATK